MLRLHFAHPTYCALPCDPRRLVASLVLLLNQLEGSMPSLPPPPPLLAMGYRGYDGSGYKSLVGIAC